MPDNRPYVKATMRKELNKIVTARLYHVHDSATFIPVHVRCTSSNPKDPRFPFVETVMGQSLVQPRVHDVHAFIFHSGPKGRRPKGRRICARFRIFFKRHARLPVNSRLGVKGDIVVMRVASHGLSSVVNMRHSDARLADYIVESVAADLRAFQGPRRKPLHTQVLMMD
ncbi:hypothetical protein DFH06DRAFT_1348520 [Mycena polygramma]|nr:hypothetical protein DFH06DRAFT_1348520 [Mycena polygramma]